MSGSVPSPSVSVRPKENSGLIASRADGCQMMPIAEGAEIVRPVSPLSCAQAVVVERAQSAIPKTHTVRPISGLLPFEKIAPLLYPAAEGFVSGCERSRRALRVDSIVALRED